MQTYLPFIKALFSEWYLFTLDNPLYAAALASAVWLLTAILYSIRIASLKRGNNATEKANLEKLAALQQQLQVSHEELAAATEQLDKAQSVGQEEGKRASALEQLIYQRNQQIAGIIQMLSSSFDLGERPLLATEDVKADLLWQQLNKAITQLIERLRIEVQAKAELQKSYQAETVKLAEKEVLLKDLQTTIDNLTNQISKLEQTLGQQNSLLQQQNNAQKALSDTLEKYHAELTRPVEPKPQPAPEPKIEPIPVTVEPVIAIQPPIVLEEKIEMAVQPISDIIDAEPQPTLIADHDEKAVIVEMTLEENTPAIEPLPTVDLTPAPDLPVIEQQPVPPPAKGSLGKIKNLFGKKPQPIKTEPQWSATGAESQIEHEPPEKNQKSPGKLKGFYNKFKSKDK